MKNEIFDNMLSRYDLTTEQHKRNAIFEVNQQMILAGLYAGGFFESAAFYGGTCLHIPADTRSAFPVISVQSPVSIQCCWQS